VEEAATGEKMDMLNTKQGIRTATIVLKGIDPLDRLNSRTFITKEVRFLDISRLCMRRRDESSMRVANRSKSIADL